MDRNDQNFILQSMKDMLTKFNSHSLLSTEPDSQKQASVFKKRSPFREKEQKVTTLIIIHNMKMFKTAQLLIESEQSEG